MNLTVRNLADDIAAAGVHFDTARGRVNTFAREGLICFDRSGPATSPNLYQPRDAAVAIVLSSLQDLGIADLDTLRDAACIAYCGMEKCLGGLARGESWTLVIDVYRHPRSGIFRNVTFNRLDQPVARAMPTDLTPRGAIIVVVDEMLRPVLRRIANGKLN